MHPRTHLLLAGLALTLAGPARADVKPHPLFTDHMVLQRDRDMIVWGTARSKEAVTVTLDGKSNKSVADEDGKWKVTLPKMAAGGPYTLAVEGPNNKVEFQDVMVGEVWVCSGQSNMEWPLSRSYQSQADIEKSANPMIRLYTVKKRPSGEPLADCEGKWEHCGPDTSKSFSAVGYYFGRDLQKALNVPVGLIHTSWGGTPAQAWTSRDKLSGIDALKYYNDDYDKLAKAYDPEKAEADYREARAKYDAAVAKAREEGKSVPKAQAKGPQKRQPPGRNPQNAATLYNGMIAPLLPFPIAGATWYQGESNNGKAYEYRTLLPAMIEDWRARWGCGEFPFLVVQLAPFWNNDSSGQSYAELREAQVMTAQKLPKVGVAVITDVGDERDIHPTKKEPVGQRLALLARDIAYGQHVASSGPVYKGMKVEGNRVILSFDHVGGGLECRGDKLVGFEVCGDDRKFQPATAVIQGDTVVVTCDQVEKPEAARYGFRNYVAGLNLWNKDGLPASPFRTDSYPGVTEKAGGRR
ncbi:MAG: sialate O-acetylesterase [Gemmataceae bacterium]